MVRHLLDRVVRSGLRSLERPGLRDLRVSRSAALGHYRTAAPREELPSARRVVDTLAVRWMGMALVGDLEVGLDGLCFRPLRGHPRFGSLAQGVRWLGLPGFAWVEDPSPPDRLPNPVGHPTRWWHPTVAAVRTLAESPGFVHHLDEVPHPTRFLSSVRELGEDDGAATSLEGFIAFTPHKLVFLTSNQKSWAAAAGQSIWNLGSIDHRPEILRRSLAWLSDEAFMAVVSRMRSGTPTFDRAAVRQAKRAGNKLSIGAFEIVLAGDEEQRLSRWLALP